ncbi:hypothetical protein ACP70R_041088 [Stipagrostis hirtigluma subsp. patula]
MARGRDGLLVLEVSSGSSVKQFASAASGSSRGGGRGSGVARAGGRSGRAARAGGRSGGSSGGRCSGGSSGEEVLSSYGDQFLADGGGHGGDSSEEGGHGGDSSEEGDSTPQGNSNNNTVASPQLAPILLERCCMARTGMGRRQEPTFVVIMDTSPRRRFGGQKMGIVVGVSWDARWRDDEDEQCKFVHWIDDAWAPRV